MVSVADLEVGNVGRIDRRSCESSGAGQGPWRAPATWLNRRENLMAGLWFHERWVLAGGCDALSAQRTNRDIPADDQAGGNGVCRLVL